jgi:uncharacterized protein YbjT (DUF2867 family)
MGTSQARPPLRGPVLVSGASGMIGRRLVPALVSAGYQVRAMTSSATAARTAADAGAQPVQADVTDPASLVAATHSCELVIRAAGQLAPRRPSSRSCG